MLSDDVQREGVICVWRPWMKFPIIGILVFFAVTKSQESAVAVKGLWDFTIFLAEGIWSFFDALIDQF